MTVKTVRRVVTILIGVVLAGVLTPGRPASATPPGGSSPNVATRSAAPPPVMTSQALPARAAGPVRALAHLDGHCNVDSSGHGDLCLWYHRNFRGSLADFYFPDDDLWDDHFVTVGRGQGYVVSNDSASDFNYDLLNGALVCTGVALMGSCAVIPPNVGGNLDTTYRNQIESFAWM
jgi:hypothetical protein